MQSTFLHYFTLTEQKNKHHFERFKPHVQECRESFTSSNIEKLLSVNNLGKQYRTCQLEPSDWIFYHFFHFVSSFVNSFFLAHYIRLYCPRHLINFNDFSFHTWNKDVEQWIKELMPKYIYLSLIGSLVRSLWAQRNLFEWKLYRKRRQKLCIFYLCK